MIADRESNSSIIVGPDGHLYVSDTFGEIIRYHLDPDERPILDEDGNPMLFFSPLDVAVHPEAGTMYVADFGEWIRPAIGREGAVWILEPME